MRRRREGRKSGWVTDPEGNRLKALAAAKERMIDESLCRTCDTERLSIAALLRRRVTRR
jgi:hypothetical protein